MSFYQFSVPTKVIHDEGISQDFAHECQLVGITKLFVVTDKTLQDIGLIEPILASLKENGLEIVGIFSDVPADSSVTVVGLCAKAAKDASAEGFLAIGGGSVMDTAKGANILFTLGGDLKEDYAGAQTITENLSPLIVIPTTAGTGSEVTEAIVIFDEETGTKLSFVDQHLMPTLAVLDPTLTVGLPPLLTAATGLDALTHAMEAVCSVQNGPISDALAYQAITLVNKYLLTAVKDGNNIEARSAMITASNLAGMAFNHAMVGVVHAVAHSVGAIAHIHHGTANGIFLPYGLEYNFEEVEERIASMASCFNLGNNDNGAKSVIAAVRNLLTDLNSACNFPLTYKDAGVKEGQLNQIAKLAADDGASFYNPRPIDAESILPFVQKAF